jgi:hypothetical protein
VKARDAGTTGRASAIGGLVPHERLTSHSLMRRHCHHGPWHHRTAHHDHPRSQYAVTLVTRSLPQILRSMPDVSDSRDARFYCLVAHVPLRFRSGSPHAEGSPGPGSADAGKIGVPSEHGCKRVLLMLSFFRSAQCR